MGCASNLPSIPSSLADLPSIPALSGPPSGMIVNDTDDTVEYTITSICQQSEQIKQRTSVNPNVSVSKEGVSAGNSGEGHIKESVTVMMKSDGLVIVPPHSKSTTGLTKLEPGKHRLSLTIKTTDKDLTMIKGIIITQSSDISLRIRKDKTIKNMTQDEVAEYKEELEYMTEKGAKPKKRGLLSGLSGALDIANPAQLQGLMDSGNNLLDKGKGLLDVPGQYLDKGKGLIDQSSKLIDKSKGLLEVPGQYLDKSKEMIDSSSKMLDKSKDLLSAPSNYLDKAKGFTESSGQLLDKSKDLLQTPNALLNKSKEVTVSSNKFLDQSKGLLDAPGKMLGKTKDVTDASSKTVDMTKNAVNNPTSFFGNSKAIYEAQLS